MAGTIRALRNLELEQSQTSQTYRDLQEFLNAQATHIRTKRHNDTNIYIRGGTSYAFPPDVIDELMQHLEKCRREKLWMRWFERRNGNMDSGMFLDFDIYQLNDYVNISQMEYTLFVSEIARILMNVLTLPHTWKAPMFVCRRPNLEQQDDTNVYKYGIHVYIPTIRASGPCRKYIINQMIQRRVDNILLHNTRLCDKRGNEANVQSTLDINSSTVPTALYGSSSKEGAQPYVIEYIYMIAASGNDIVSTEQQKLLDTNQQWNLVRMLSLNHALPEPNGIWMPPKTYDPRPELVTKISESNERVMMANVYDAEEMEALDDNVSTLCTEDPTARCLRMLLSLLPPRYADEYEKWRNAILAIASTGKQSYYSMAEWFTRRCPEKWHKREAKLHELWNSGLHGTTGRPVTIRSLMYWVHQEVPQEQYNLVLENLYFEILLRYAREFEGDLGHRCIADLLASVLSDRFVCDRSYPDGADICWYEFVSNPKDCKPGEIYKYRDEGRNPITLLRFISERLPDVFTRAIQYFDAAATNAKDEVGAKWYGGIIKKLKTYRGKLLEHPYKENVVKASVERFMVRGFSEQLEDDDKVLGVGNGIVLLDSTIPTIICGFHEYKVKRYTKTPAVWFNPNDEWTKFVFQKFFADIIPEPDVRMKVLLNMASCLDGDVKDVELLEIVGPGSNGKTVLLEQFRATLGDKYAPQMDISLLMCGVGRETGPNTALMQAKGARAMVFSESERAGVMSPARLKQLSSMGEKISANEKNKKQETFKPTGQLFSASNWPMRIESSDDGLWRRISVYWAPIRFVANPDPNNPNEKQVDYTFKTKYVNHPMINQAFLSILLKGYWIYKSKYNGSIQAFRSVTIQRQTEEYRNQTDKINRFLSEKIIVCPDEPERHITFAEICDCYLEWHRATFLVSPASSNKGTQFSATDMEEILENSALRKFIKTSIEDTSKNMIYNIRLPGITDAEATPQNGEHWLAVNRGNINMSRVTPFDEDDWVKFCTEPMPAPVNSKAAMPVPMTGSPFDEVKDDDDDEDEE